MSIEQLMTGKLGSTNQAYVIAKLAGIEMCTPHRQQYRFDCIILFQLISLVLVITKPYAKIGQLTLENNLLASRKIPSENYIQEECL